MPPFDHLTANFDDVIARAESLPGMTLGEIASASGFDWRDGGKGSIGRIVESFFGIAGNNRPEADFRDAGLELKTVPVIGSGKRLRVKERTVISMIDYTKLVGETWATASVRHKLHCLFVFVEAHPDMPVASRRVLAAFAWSPSPVHEGLIRSDWERVRKKVSAGRAHELSEADGLVMGPCTKGATGADRRRQPSSEHLAKPRAWALKQSFVLDVFRAGPSGAADGQERSRGRFEADIADRMRPLIGLTVEQAARHMGTKLSPTAKNAGASVIRAALSGAARSGSGKLPPEFGMMGLTPRSPKVSPELRPYDAISFPCFDYFELLDEQWEDSELLEQVQYMLIIPLVARDRKTPLAACQIGEPVYWSPSAELLAVMREEWERARAAIRNGEVDAPLPASESVAIHVRPHAATGKDRVPAPAGRHVVKKSFWLNRGLVQQVLRREI